MSMTRRRLIALFVAILGAAIAAPEALSRPRVLDRPVLATVPYMGWNTYYGVGGVFDQHTILSVARSLLHRGLARAGYRIVWLDFGWATGARDRHGRLIISRRQWPHGLAWLTRWLHHHGLLAGIYTDAGASGCYGRGVGSLGHYREDVGSFAAWGFDAVKVDFCGAGQQGLDPRRAYTSFARALVNNASHRPMLLNVDNFWAPGQINGKRPTVANSSFGNYRWARGIAQSWRTDTDIGFTGSIVWRNVLRNLSNDEAHWRAGGPGHWNDPDYLGPGLGMTRSQAQAQLSMWAMVAAPLILGSDPRKLGPGEISMLENPRVIAIDQDPLGIQARVAAQTGAAQVWSRPLAAGQRAVALLNRAAAPLRITVGAARAGFAPDRAYRLYNVWTRRSRAIRGTISVRVPGDSVVLYRAAPL